jgi:hypothetical protein
LHNELFNVQLASKSIAPLTEQQPFNREA